MVQTNELGFDGLRAGWDQKDLVAGDATAKPIAESPFPFRDVSVELEQGRLQARFRQGADLVLRCGGDSAAEAPISPEDDVESHRFVRGTVRLRSNSADMSLASASLRMRV
jgi:hypothetical protein